MDLQVRKSSYAGRNYRWIASEHGVHQPQGGTLDLSKFDFASVFTTRRIPSGCVLGRVTATGKYGPYNNSATDGREVAVGFLLDHVDVPSAESTGDRPVAILWHGSITEANLPTNHGLDAAAKTDMAGRIYFR